MAVKKSKSSQSKGKTGKQKVKAAKTNNKKKKQQEKKKKKSSKASPKLPTVI